LLEQLLAGRPVAPGPALNAARACGLDAGASLAVLVARPRGGEPDEQALGVAARALARAAGDVPETLAAVRDGEIVIVRAVADGTTTRLVGALGMVHRRLERE